MKLSEIYKERIEDNTNWELNESEAKIFGNGATFALDEICGEVAIRFFDWAIKEYGGLYLGQNPEHRYTTAELFALFMETLKNEGK